MDKQVIKEIKQISGCLHSIEHVGCLFMIGDRHCMYMDNKDPRLLKFTVPCLTTVTNEEKQQVTNIINQVN